MQRRFLIIIMYVYNLTHSKYHVKAIGGSIGWQLLDYVAKWQVEVRWSLFYGTERIDELNHGTERFLKLKLATHHCWNFHYKLSVAPTVDD